MKTALQDCINGNINITLENYRHQRTVNLTNNAQTNSWLVAMLKKMLSFISK